MACTERASRDRQAVRKPLQALDLAPERQRQVGEGELAVHHRHEVLATHLAEHVEHAAVQHLPGADLLLDHRVASLIEVDRHGGKSFGTGPHSVKPRPR
jgi:hypothetical protein